MQFDVPQFVESETKIAGSLTFRQVLYLAAAGIVVMVSYFGLAKTNLGLFIFITVLAIVFGLAFAFLKIGGFSLAVFLKNLIFFLISAKVYLWRKPAVAPKVIQKRIASPAEAEKEKTLKMGGESRLNKLSTQIETNTQ